MRKGHPINAEIRQRHVAHAITLTQHVREILKEITAKTTDTATHESRWTAAEESIDIAELLLTKLTTLHQKSHWIDNV